MTGSNRNVFKEVQNESGKADYVLRTEGRENPLIIIEAKNRGKDLNEALKQAKRYAHSLKSPIAYASDGSSIKTYHLKNDLPLMLNGEKVEHFLDEVLALQFLDKNEVYTVSKKVIQSRQELISIFSKANNELRKEGLQAGIDRFSEFCNILFLKLFSEEECIRIKSGKTSRVDIEFLWDNFKSKDGNELLSYVNDTVISKFADEYKDSSIFNPLLIKNPRTLKKIIDSLEDLSLVDTNSDIKGDAFEYFLKAYLANQKKDLGEYFTPRHIVKTLVKLINPKFGERIYDPFCGTGGMLIESFKHIYNKMPMNEDNLKLLQQETIYGGEITQNAKITKMNMILTGDGHNNIVRHDSLGHPDISKNKFDVVITNMPFSLGAYPEYKGLYYLGNSNADSLCIEHCFNAIDPKSDNPRIGVIIPEGILFDNKFTKLREFIYNNSTVQDIVSLPYGAFKPYTDVKTSILYLTQVKQKKEKQYSVRHFTVNNDGYTMNTKRIKKQGENDLDIFLSYKDSQQEDNLMHIGFNNLLMKTIEDNKYISILAPYKKFEFTSDFDFTPLSQLIENMTIRNDKNFLYGVLRTIRVLSAQKNIFKSKFFQKIIDAIK